MSRSIPSCHRRMSNELRGSVRMEELRALQAQLASVVQDAGPIPDPELGDDDSTVSAITLSTADDSLFSAASESDYQSSPNDSSPEVPAEDATAADIEAGIPPSGGPLPPTYRRHSSGDGCHYQRCNSVETEVMSNTTGSSSSSASANQRLTLPAATDNTVPFGGAASVNQHPTSEGPFDGAGAVDPESLSVASSKGSKGSRLRRRVTRTRRAVFKVSASGRWTGKEKLGPKQKLGLTQRRQRVLHSKGDLDESLKGLHDFDFLEREDEDHKESKSLIGGARWWRAVFFFSLAAFLACAVTLWAPYPLGARMPTAMVAATPWSDGCRGLDSCICPRETICADDLVSMIFLTIARCSAWFDYPLYMVLFLSKAHNLNNFLQQTALRCWINFSDYHHVHSLFGIIVGIESTSHSFFHLLRWARRKDDIQLLLTTRTGITGLIAIILIPFIVLPMTLPYLKKRMTFEYRKGLHYLALVWAAALMCHAPQRIFYLIGVPFFIYLADKAVLIFFKTHLVESAHFQRLGDSSCIVSFENPPGFGRQNSAYAYLMLPWLSRSQFHAFTVFPCTKEGHYSMCISKSGDWTEKLIETITTPTHKPAFLVGPFVSPFSSPAMDSDFLVAVASGIGVTPAISLIKQYSATTRRLNLVWVCRDPGLVEHFLQNVEFGNDGYTLIYYTGKERPLVLKDDLPPNMFIFDRRPNLERTISGIIASIATGEDLPEELQRRKFVTRTPAALRSRLLLQKALSIYTMEQLFDYTLKASNYRHEGPEPLVSAVSYQGVLSTMKHLLGDDITVIADKVTKNFEKIDTDGDRHIDLNEFEAFVKLMVAGEIDKENVCVASVERGVQQMSRLGSMFEASKDQANIDPGIDEFGIRRHLQGDGKFQARNWNMLYCGGSQPVVDQLKTFKHKFGIGLSIEKFDW